MNLLTVKLFIKVLVELIELPFLAFFSLLSRFFPKAIDIGLGPEPMINNVYHKKALEIRGYSAETFVDSVFFITDEFDRKFIPKNAIMGRLLRQTNYIFVYSLFRYRCLYFYFNGSGLYRTSILWLFEPWLYRIAGIRTVIMPYGGDVQDMQRTPNLMMRHVVAKDYPLQRNSRKKIAAKIEIWTAQADHVIAGCDWVDYMPFWHTLMVAHFSIDTQKWAPTKIADPSIHTARSFRVLHAPNHKAIKGTDFFIRAVQELRDEGENIELVLAEKLPNDEIRRLIESVDVVADQLIIGWYAMFAIESMSLGKPVLCYLRDDLQRLYIDSGLLREDEIPLINCAPNTVKEKLQLLMHNPVQLDEAGRRGMEYVNRHHSLEAVGAVFAEINKSIGLHPNKEKETNS